MRVNLASEYEVLYEHSLAPKKRDHRRTTDMLTKTLSMLLASPMTFASLSRSRSSSVRVSNSAFQGGEGDGEDADKGGYIYDGVDVEDQCPAYQMHMRHIFLEANN